MLEEFAIDEEIDIGDEIHYIKNTGKDIIMATNKIRSIYFDYSTVDIPDLILYYCMNHIRKGGSCYKDFIRDITLKIGKKYGYNNILEELPGLRLGNRFLCVFANGKHYRLYGDGHTFITKIPHILAISKINYRHRLLLNRLKRFLSKYGYFTHGGNSNEEF